LEINRKSSGEGKLRTAKVGEELLPEPPVKGAIYLRRNVGMYVAAGPLMNRNICGAVTGKLR
jgi:hypothetical protein